MKVGSLRRIAVFFVLASGAQSLPAATAQPSLLRLPVPAKPHTVTLTWEPSASHVSSYNVYRKGMHESDYRKITSSPVEGLTYTDKNVESGATYHYVVRAVDAQGHESVNSQEFTVVIP